MGDTSLLNKLQIEIENLRNARGTDKEWVHEEKVAFLMKKWLETTNKGEDHETERAS